MQQTKTGDSVTDTLWFFYDNQGNRIGLCRDGDYFYYLYNVQGDVTALVDAETGKIAVTYQYGAWGEQTGMETAEGYGDLGTANPFRYRGYYWDEESGLYYLNSRYYSPELCRFISADSQINGDVLGTNLFAYCSNNPVNRTDESGHWFGLDDLIAAGVGLIVGVGAQFVSDVVTSTCSGSLEFSSVQTYVGAAVGGAIGGVTALYAGPIVGACVSAGTSTLIGQGLENAYKIEERSTSEILINSVVDATVGGTISYLVPIKISGITTGRNSMASVYSSGLTKLGNGTASRMSGKVFGKGIVSQLAFSLGTAGAIGFRNYITIAAKELSPAGSAQVGMPIVWSPQ